MMVFFIREFSQDSCVVVNPTSTDEWTSTDWKGIAESIKQTAVNIGKLEIWCTVS
jgi:hypothetical protein